ncbi:MAG: SPASM domain-containing protein, partial [Rhodospirillales bacterium]|nr:SPASM domain-containing protein [Rhodospirillales bacterium]
GHQVDFNALTVVHRQNARKPREVYRFLKSIGVEYMQFIPIVERTADGKALAGAPEIDEEGVAYRVTPWSVLPNAYGDFLCGVFDEWIKEDVGRIFVQFFDVQLGLWMGEPAGLCWFAETCGQGLAIEHNGDLYACDHYVYPQYRLGNILETPIADLAASPEQKRFGDDKRDTLPRQCRECEYRFACNGGCPKHRFLATADGEPGLNYFCQSYMHFFTHAGPYLRTMAEFLRRGRPAADIMEAVRQRPRKSPSTAGTAKVGRNIPCPCGSGKKYKTCCG